MNKVMKAITKLCNMQRDKHLKQDQQKKVVRKGSGFDEILRKEQKKLERR